MYKSALKEYQKSRSKISPETKSWFQSWGSQPKNYHVLGGIPSASNPITGFTKAREKDAVYSRLGEEQWETNTMQCKWSPTPSKRWITRQAGFGMLELQCKTGRLLVNSFSTASTSDIRSKNSPIKTYPMTPGDTLVHCLVALSSTSRLAVSLPLLDIGVPPCNGHQLSCIRIMFDHVETWAPTFGCLNFLPSVHGVLNILANASYSSTIFSRLPESSEEAVVFVYLIFRIY